MTVESTYNKVFNKEFVDSKEKMGLRLVGLYANHTPAIAISEAFADPEYRWSTTTLLDDESKRYSLQNMAIITGPTYVTGKTTTSVEAAGNESENRQQHILSVFDNDCPEMFNHFSIPISQILSDSSWHWVTDKVRILVKEFLAEEGIVNGDYNTILDVIKQSGYVTKTRKEYGFHVPYLDPNQHPAIKSGDCNEGKEFEIHTGKHLCTLPGSSYRPPKEGEEDPDYDPDFRYTQIGLDNRVIISSVLYDLICAIGETECLKDSKLDGILNRNNDNNNSSGSINSHSNINISNSDLSDDLKLMTTLLMMMSDSVVIPEHHRHNTLLSVACSILFKHSESKRNDELRYFFMQINQKCCYPIPLPDSEVEQIWKDATEFVSNSKSKKKVTPEDIKFVIKTMMKEAPYDEVAIRQLFLGLCSAFTKKPIHHNINSRKSGAGKNYLLELVSRPFPRKYIMELAGMSDKALMHEQGVDVIVIDEETQKVVPIKPIINELEKLLDECTDKLKILKKINAKAKTQTKAKSSDDDDDDTEQKELSNRIKDYHNKINEIYARSQKLIDLTNRIIIILDTGSEGLYNALMSITSQDVPRDQIYQFTDKKGSGKLGATKNRLRGTPCMFTTQVIDDTRQIRYQEKNRRFVHVTPNTSAEKMDTALDLIGYKYGCTPGAYDNLVVSREDKERCKEIVATLVYKLIKSSKPLAPDELGVAIFYTRSISHSLSSKVIKSDGWIMTVMNRLMKYLTVIVRINADTRPKLEDTVTGVSYPIATFGDLREALQLMSMASSELRPYVAYMYNNVFLPYFNNPNRIKECEQNRTDEFRTESGKSIMSVVEPNGISTKELADAIKTTMKLASRPSNDDVLKYYLYPLLNQGVINKEKNPYSLNENLWSPAETGNIFSMFSGDDIRLEIKDRVLYPNKISIEESFRTFVDFRYKQHGILDKNISDSDTANNPNPNTRYKLVDPEDNEISLDVLIERYLSNPESCFIQRNRLDLEWLSISGSEGLGISHTQDPEKYNFVSKYHPTCSGTLQQFSNEGVKKSNLQNEPTSSTISESPSNSGRIYRLWVGGDEWGCSNCKIKGDRFEVDGHDCRKWKKSK